MVGFFPEISKNFWMQRVVFKKYKTFSVLICGYINTSENGKTRNYVETRCLQGRVFSLLKFRVFPISTNVDITVYLYGKNVLYFFYDIAQKMYI